MVLKLRRTYITFDAKEDLYNCMGEDEAVSQNHEVLANILPVRQCERRLHDKATTFMSSNKTQNI